MFEAYRKIFSSETTWGWIAPLFIPIVLWYLSVNQGIRDEGLIGEIGNRNEVLSQVKKHAEDIENFPGEPIISIHNARDGNEEMRLIVRTVVAKAKLNKPLSSFIFSGFMALLLALWGGAIAWRFVPPLKDETGVAKKSKGETGAAKRFDMHRKLLDDIIAFFNTCALIFFFGFQKIIEYIK